LYRRTGRAATSIGEPPRISDNRAMPLLTNATPVAYTTVPPNSLDVDLLVVPWFEDEDPAWFAGLDRAVSGEISRSLASKEFAARPFDLFVTPVADRSWKIRRVALIGGGSKSAYGTSLARKLATAAALHARQRRVGRLAFLLRPGVATPAGDVDVAGLVQAITEGLTLAEFDVSSYKTVEPAPAAAPACTIAAQDYQDTSPESRTRVEAAIARGRILGECSNLARGLANEPSNTLTPREFAARAAALAGEAGVGVEILDERQIESLGMGLLLGVARGSNEPPRLMVFRHDPPEASSQTPVLGLVGKGITFDTGGISIKPADGMERMKDDMAGGAAVACAMRAIAQLRAPIRVIGVVPATENMPGGRAVKPGDIIKSAEGKTVEIINTDAEGRLILADGLWYARKLGATHLIDVATLTGAIVVALGKTTSGLFGSPDAWVEHVRKVADRAGDRAWRMPIFDDYNEQLKSDIADLMNSGGRPAGSITAALFLKEFAGGLPWAHMDIAGTAWVDEAKPHLPKGPTGVAVRTLAELAFTAHAWPK
jgi:leucyl aminopeptidase